MRRVLILLFGALVFAVLMFYIKEVQGVHFFCKEVIDNELTTKIYCQKKIQ